MLIGFAGAAGSGKSSACAAISKMRFQELSFAGPLKAACQSIFGFTADQLFGDKKELVDPHWGMSPREVMQRFGTDAIKPVFGEDIWYRVWHRNYKSLSGFCNVSVSDVRFPLEADRIKQLGGMVIKIRSNKATIDRSKHFSERALDDYIFDDIWENNYRTVQEWQEFVTLEVEYLLRGVTG